MGETSLHDVEKESCVSRITYKLYFEIVAGEGEFGLGCLVKTL